MTKLKKNYKTYLDELREFEAIKNQNKFIIDELENYSVDQITNDPELKKKYDDLFSKFASIEKKFQSERDKIFKQK